MIQQLEKKKTDKAVLLFPTMHFFSLCIFSLFSLLLDNKHHIIPFLFSYFYFISIAH